MTNAQLVLNELQNKLCHEGTTYKGPSGTYKYIIGRTTSSGTINGVVKKLHEDGSEKTAGSFKILSDGTVTRFTGVPTKTYRSITKEIQLQNTTETSVIENQPEAIAV